MQMYSGRTKTPAPVSGSLRVIHTDEPAFDESAEDGFDLSSEPERDDLTSTLRVVARLRFRFLVRLALNNERTCHRVRAARCKPAIASSIDISVAWPASLLASRRSSSAAHASAVSG